MHDAVDYSGPSFFVPADTPLVIPLGSAELESGYLNRAVVHGGQTMSNEKCVIAAVSTGPSTFVPADTP